MDDERTVDIIYTFFGHSEIEKLEGIVRENIVRRGWLDDYPQCIKLLFEFNFIANLSQSECNVDVKFKLNVRNLIVIVFRSTVFFVFVYYQAHFTQR